MHGPGASVAVSAGAFVASAPNAKAFRVTMSGGDHAPSTASGAPYTRSLLSICEYCAVKEVIGRSVELVGRGSCL